MGKGTLKILLNFLVLSVLIELCGIDGISVSSGTVFATCDEACARGAGASPRPANGSRVHAVPELLARAPEPWADA